MACPRRNHILVAAGFSSTGQSRPSKTPAPVFKAGFQGTIPWRRPVRNSGRVLSNSIQRATSHVRASRKSTPPLDNGQRKISSGVARDQLETETVSALAAAGRRPSTSRTSVEIFQRPSNAVWRETGLGNNFSTHAPVMMPSEPSAPKFGNRCLKVNSTGVVSCAVPRSGCPRMRPVRAKHDFPSPQPRSVHCACCRNRKPSGGAPRHWSEGCPDLHRSLRPRGSKRDSRVMVIGPPACRSANNTAAIDRHGEVHRSTAALTLFSLTP